MVADHSNALRHSLIDLSAFIVLLVLEGSAAALQPVDVVVGRDETVAFIAGSLGELVLVAEGRSHWRAHLIVSQSLADIIVAAKCDIASDCRLVLVESSSIALLLPLLHALIELLLLLLLLCEVELVDTAMTILRGKSGH